jgi:hypothetical protein
MPRWAHTIGPPHQELTEHVGPVAAVALGRLGDRDIIVSASHDRTLRIWDARAASILEVVDLLGIPRGVTIAQSGESIYAASIRAICAFTAQAE